MLHRENLAVYSLVFNEKSERSQGIPNRWYSDTNSKRYTTCCYQEMQIALIKKQRENHPNI